MKMSTPTPSSASRRDPVAERIARLEREVEMWKRRALEAEWKLRHDPHDWVECLLETYNEVG